MSRKLIFFFIALSVFSYFGVIIMILGPLSGVGPSLYANRFGQRLGQQRVPSVHWCKGLRWRSPPARRPVALVSFPGSGNTWLRYLLQQLTGIVTGSVYMDYGLRLHGFPAENVTDGSVLVVKTHEFPPTDPDQFSAAVLLIRNPRDAILADYNWLHKGHIGSAPKSAFRKKSPTHQSSEWSRYVRSRLAAWRALHGAWLARWRRPLLVLFYARLVRRPARALRRLLAFLNHTATEEDMRCTLANREGIYRRRKRYEHFEPFTRAMRRRLRAASRQLLLALRNCTGADWQDGEGDGDGDVW